MIQATVKPAINLKKDKEALFVSFPYSLENVAKIKSLPLRFFIPASKEWEVPTASLAEVLEMFADEQISLTGKVSTEGTVAPSIKFQDHPQVDFEFKTTPFEHQIHSFQYAKAHDKFLLGDEQGLGKTKQAIDIAISRKHLMKHCLIVCGVNSLKHNWLKEVGIHSNEKAVILGTKVDAKGKLKEGGVKERLEHLNSEIDEFFIITNVETLRSEEMQNKLKELTMRGIIGMAVVDEIHKCKNAQSQQGKAIHCLKTKFKLALTGTPLMNQAMDLYNIMKWLEVEKNSFYQFRARYCVMGGYGNYQIVGYRNMDELKRRIGQVMLRRKKDEVLNLPPKIRSTDYVDMTPKQAQLYKEVKNMLKANIKEIELNPNPLAMLIRLRQVTAHTSILSDSIAESAKMERLKEIVEELVENGQKAIIFSNWEEVAQIVKSELSQYNPAYITGSTKDRQAEVERFQADAKCKLIIGTVGAMGTGLTLTKASTVIFMDKAWNMATVEQAEDRAHRIGTTGTVNIISLVCKDTIDENIEAIVESKKFLAEELVDGASNGSKAEQLKLIYQILGEE